MKHLSLLVFPLIFLASISTSFAQEGQVCLVNPDNCPTGYHCVRTAENFGACAQDAVGVSCAGTGSCGAAGGCPDGNMCRADHHCYPDPTNCLASCTNPGSCTAVPGFVCGSDFHPQPDPTGVCGVSDPYLGGGCDDNGACNNGYLCYNGTWIPSRNCPVTGITASYTGTVINSMATLFAKIFNVMFPLAILFGVIMIIRGGYVIMTSEGNPQKTKEGQEDLTAAILGTAFVALSASILRIIITQVLGGTI